jgi:hypothetical protein
MNANPLLIFLHIPKTAGSTMHHILARQYPPAAVYSIAGDRVQESYDALRALPATDKAQLACVKGHLPYGVHEFFRQPATYITFLRDPANWVRSYYTFILSIPSHPLRQAVAACNGVEEFCALLTEWGMNNFQTRILAGTQAHETIMPPYGPLPEHALETAIAHLEAQVTVTGLAEQFDASLLMMKRRLGWGNVHYLRQNVTRGKPATLRLTEEQKALIYRDNALDLALYQYARERLQKQIEAEGASFQSQLRRFKVTNRLFSGAYPCYMRLRLHRLKAGCRQLARIVRGG